MTTVAVWKRSMSDVVSFINKMDCSDRDPQIVRDNDPGFWIVFNDVPTWFLDDLLDVKQSPKLSIIGIPQGYRDAIPANRKQE